MSWLDFFSGNRSGESASRRTSTPRREGEQTTSTNAGVKRRVLGIQPPAPRATGQPRPVSSGGTVPKAIVPPSALNSGNARSSGAAKAPRVTAKRTATTAKASRAVGKASANASTKRGSKTVVSPTGNRTSKTASGTDIMVTPEGRKRFIETAKTPKGRKKTVTSYDEGALKKAKGSRGKRQR